MKHMADARSKDSAEALVFDCTSLGIITGPSASEYTQKTHSKVEIHKYPSGKEVAKPCLDEDFILFDIKHRRINQISEATMKSVH